MSISTFLKIKKLDETAKVPKKAYDGDGGLDIYATDFYEEGDFVVYKTGIALEIEKGFAGLLFPRSSITKTDLMLGNSIGLIDSGYRGEVLIKMRKMKETNSYIYEPGEKIAQLVIMKLPLIYVTEVTNLSPSDRDIKGFGSSGK